MMIYSEKLGKAYITFQKIYYEKVYNELDNNGYDANIFDEYWSDNIIEIMPLLWHDYFDFSEEFFKELASYRNEYITLVDDEDSLLHIKASNEQDAIKKLENLFIKHSNKCKKLCIAEGKVPEQCSSAGGYCKVHKCGETKKCNKAKCPHCGWK